MTIGFTLRPLPDELLPSVIARQGMLLDRPDCGLGDLMTLGLSTNRPGLPMRLRRLAATLGDGRTAEQLADRHTLLPYYEGFATPTQSAAMRLRLFDGVTVAGEAQFVADSVTKDMNSCPECVREDLAGEAGEVGWRRAHSLPGVSVCWLHGTELRRRPITTLGRRRLLPFPSCPEECGAPVVGLVGDMARVVAENSRWLLDHSQVPREAPVLRAAVLAMLREDGWLRDASIRPGLRRELIRRFGGQELRGIGCHLNEETSSRDWVAHMSRHKLRPGKVPLHHILLVTFLGRHVSELFDDPGPGDHLQVREDEGHAVDPDAGMADTARHTEPHRMRVTAALAERPTASRSELNRMARLSFAYLRAFDLEWLQARLPPPRKKGGSRKGRI